MSTNNPSDPNVPAGEAELPPDQAPAADLPKHARERLSQMRRTHFFTSDLSVNEFLLVKQAGFEPLGLVMGSSIYNIRPNLSVPGTVMSGTNSGEVKSLTQALYHSRELAMTRMEEEADALGADGIIGVRLDVNLHAWGRNVAEFVAVGTAVRHVTGKPFRNSKGKPFTSDLSGQDFWTLLRAGYRPAGFVMGNCAYYVNPRSMNLPQSGPGFWAAMASAGVNGELTEYTHHFYDARELAIERLQIEAEELGAEGIVGVTVEDNQHSWGTWWQNSGTATQRGNAALRYGEILEFFVIGTAVVRMEGSGELPVPSLVIDAGK
jgi:uncharacterized protein YbjQ (UPF0145 family)